MSIQDWTPPSLAETTNQPNDHPPTEETPGVLQLPRTVSSDQANDTTGTQGPSFAGNAADHSSPFGASVASVVHHEAPLHEAPSMERVSPLHTDEAVDGVPALVPADPIPALEQPSSGYTSTTIDPKLLQQDSALHNGMVSRLVLLLSYWFCVDA